MHPAARPIFFVAMSFAKFQTRSPKKSIYWFTREPEFSICRKNAADNFLRGRGFHFSCRNARAGFSRQRFGIDLATETRSSIAVSSNRQRRLGCINGSRRRRLRPCRRRTREERRLGTRSRDCCPHHQSNRRLLNALFTRDAKILVGLPIGGLMILYLVRIKRPKQ